ncbi:MAG: class I SAM-dependent methyltransferase [Anaerolinea sp.]|nr:class I SAM-dependent methyltransferase [Anaerolinea sp.]
MPSDYSARLSQFMHPLAAAIAPAHIILEIGTGTGALVPVLGEIVPQATVIAVDLAWAMLVQATKRCPSAHFAQADAHALPFPTDSIDVAICHNSFPHFADQHRALRELLRILKSRGWALILHNNPRDVVNAIHSRAGYPIDADLLPPGDVLRSMLIETGFSSVHVEDTDRHYVVSGRKP